MVELSVQHRALRAYAALPVDSRHTLLSIGGQTWTRLGQLSLNSAASGGATAAVLELFEDLSVNLLIFCAAKA